MFALHVLYFGQALLLSPTTGVEGRVGLLLTGLFMDLPKYGRKKTRM
jgi:hypothetical protein